MTKQITVSQNIDTSKELQALIDKTGNTAAEYIFSPDHDIEINSLLRNYNYTEWSGNGCKMNLAENVDPNIFGVQIPIIGSKYNSGIEGLSFHDITFDGNRDTQNKTPVIKNKRWGNGYHNFFMLGSLSSVSFSNSLNCSFYNLAFNNNLGDGIRIEGGRNILIHDITGKRGGHDIVCFSGVYGGECYNLKADLAVNAGVRTRSAKNIKIHDCELNGGTGIAYCPGFQIQSTATNWISEKIEIYNNYVYNTYGPGIQVVGKVPNNGIVDIHNNRFVGCGQMPKGNELPNVGAIVADGFPTTIRNNTIDGSYGYGVLVGDYNEVSPYSYNFDISRNIITNTKKALYPGTMSGKGIACLTGPRNTVKVDENCQFGNITGNHYKVTVTKNIDLDPCYIGNGDYHLKDDSPCILNGYELGAYNGVDSRTPITPTQPAVVIPKENDDALNEYIKSLKTAGLLKDGEYTLENV